jgi:excisionase family DNA binding protein
MEEKILTPEQVAKILQIHQFTVLKFIKQGRLKASRLGRVYRIKESDVELFLEESAKKTSTTDVSPNLLSDQVKNRKNKKQKQTLPFSQTDAGDDATTEPNLRSTEIDVIEEGNGESKAGGHDQYYLLE